MVLSVLCWIDPDEPQFIASSPTPLTQFRKQDFKVFGFFKNNCKIQNIYLSSHEVDQLPLPQYGNKYESFSYL